MEGGDERRSDGYYTGIESRVYLDPAMTEFVQVGDEVYRTQDVVEVLVAAALEDVNRSVTAKCRRQFTPSTDAMKWSFPGFGAEEAAT